MYIADANGLGFSLNPIKHLKKAASAVSSAAQAAARAAAYAATLPFRLAMEAVIRLVIPLGRALCTVPQFVIEKGAMAAGVSPHAVPVFCKALNLNNMAEVKSLLPVVLKIAVKVAATGAAPGIGPLLANIHRVPGLKLIPGLSFLAGTDDQAMYGIDGFAGALAGMSDAQVAGALSGASMLENIRLRRQAEARMSPAMRAQRRAARLAAKRRGRHGLPGVPRLHGEFGEFGAAPANVGMGINLALAAVATGIGALLVMQD